MSTPRRVAAPLIMADRVADLPTRPYRGGVSTTIRVAMPMYEFDCEECGERFEDLVAAGTEHAECRHCGSEATHRVLSAPGAQWKLVKTLGSARKQELANAKLHADTKAQFKETRKKGREQRAKGNSKGS